ncbi:MAG: hypothetical protein SPG10_16760 [Enterocloster clostridioformis]|uniref:hypothetical protein n=1 Tax=Enterocloster clostridioformis TaxID=1531 RepID=UPI001FA79AA1|nr:hypothetical protein [Enterocloster clostridioformis]MDY5478429.1 hypothetical protein [Enterocloster clostridioformis]
MDELMMELTGTVERMKESGVFSAEKEISVIKAVTPDFHKGKGGGGNALCLLQGAGDDTGSMGNSSYLLRGMGNPGTEYYYAQAGLQERNQY